MAPVDVSEEMSASQLQRLAVAPRTGTILLGISALLLAVGTYLGLCVAPPERMMGDVYRILYVHVPSAWMGLTAYTATFALSVAYLMGGRMIFDAWAHAACEVGVVFNALVLVTGAIWGRPTWGVWWTFDPRLTSAAVMLFLFLGVLALRRVVEAPAQRASWSAVSVILAFVSIPVVWKSVQWWNSLHQLQSSPETMAAPMVLALRVNAFAFLFLAMALVQLRARVRLADDRALSAEPPLAPPPEAAR